MHQSRENFHEVQKYRTVAILLSNFSRHPRSLPKGVVIALVSSSPLAVVSLTSGVAHELGAINTTSSPLSRRRNPRSSNNPRTARMKAQRKLTISPIPRSWPCSATTEMTNHHPQSLRWLKKELLHQTRLPLLSQPSLPFSQTTIQHSIQRHNPLKSSCSRISKGQRVPLMRSGQRV